MSSELSKKIATVNVILTILIVFLHSECFSYIENPNIVTSSLSKIGLVLTQIAVPSFFALSAILFFRNYDKSNYISKIKKRFMTLIVPYLFWSTFFLIVFFVISKFKFFLSFDGVFTPIQNNIPFILNSIVMAEYGEALWYLRALFILILLSPIFYRLSRLNKHINCICLIISIVLVFLFKVDYFNFCYWIPIYYVASYFAINYKNKLFSDKLYLNKRVTVTLYFVYICLFIFYIILYNNFYISFFYRLISPFIVYITMKSCNIEFNLSRYAKYTFLVYCIHRWVTIAVKKVLVLVLGINQYTALIYQPIVAIITIIIMIVTIKILENISFRFLSFISGNRLKTDR